MKLSPTMQRTIEQLAAKYEVDLARPGAYLRLEMPGFDRLSVENIGGNRISVAHYYEQNGDLIADPEIVFFTCWLGWYAVEITQVFTGWRRLASIDERGHITAADLSRQADVARFANRWARNIQEEGWQEHGRLARVARPGLRKAS